MSARWQRPRAGGEFDPDRARWLGGDAAGQRLRAAQMLCRALDEQVPGRTHLLVDATEPLETAKPQASTQLALFDEIKPAA